MHTPLSLRLAWRELTAHKKLSLIFVVNLALGLTGLIALISFSDSFTQHMAGQSRALLGGDLAMAARRFLKADEESKADSLLPAGTAKTKMISLYSMAAGPARSRLVEIKAIEAAFPYYGQLTLQERGAADRAAYQELEEGPAVWVYPELLSQLGLGVGGQLKIGQSSFRIAGVVVDDSPVSWAGASLAPRLYMAYGALAATGLLQPGATLWQSVLYKLPPGFDARALVSELNQALPDPGLRIQSHFDASEQTGRLVAYLSDYLGLAALAAFFLAIIATSYFFYAYFSNRLRELAILLALGLEARQVIAVFLWQVVLLSTGATLMTLLASALLLNVVLPPLTAKFFAQPLVASLSAQAIASAGVVSLLASLLSSLPLVLPLRRLQPAVLLQDEPSASLGLSLRRISAYGPTLVVFWLLAVWQAHSWRIGSLFVGSFAGAALLFTAAYALLSRWGRQGGAGLSFLPLKLARAYLTRKAISSLVAFLALALGALLINLIPQLRHNLSAELAASDENNLPSLFLFDIQADQVEPLSALFTKAHTQLNYLSPLVAARLLAINDKAMLKPSAEEAGRVAKTREEEREQATRSRSYNLSYRAELAPSESLVAGRPFTKGPLAGRPAEISLEERFAKRLGVDLGDKLTFDIEGVSISGVVVNLRKVRWTSFHPNFFIQFEPGVLDEAPKTFLAAIPPLPAAQLESLQNAMAQEFPNISLVNVSRIVDNLLALSERMADVLNWMALLTLITGFVVLFSIAHYQSRQRFWDITLLKVLGASSGLIRTSLYLEFMVLSFSAALCGGLAACVGSYLFTRLVFDGQWRLDLGLIALISCGIVGCALLVCQLAHGSLFRTKAADILN